MTTLYKGEIAPSDFKLWDGATGTYDRNTDTGGSETLNRMAWAGVDVLELFGNKTNRNLAAISAALTRIGSSNKVPIWLSPGTWTIDDDLTIPANVSLCLPPGALLTVSSAKTLTVNGSIATGWYQVFSGDGSIVFGDGSIPCIFPEWWGIDGTADEVEIAKAVAAATNVKTVQLLDTTYYLDDKIDVDVSNILLRGSAMHQTVLSAISSCKAAASEGLIDIGAVSKITVEQMTINGNKDNNGSGEYAAIYGEDSSYLDVHDVTIKEMPKNAINLEGSNDNSKYKIYNNYFDENDGRDIYAKNSSVGRITNNIHYKTGGNPIYLDHDAEYVKILNNLLWNPNDAEDDTIMTGIWIGSGTYGKTAKRIQILGNTIIDDNTTKKNDYGVTLDSTKCTISYIQILGNDMDVETLGVYYIDTSYSNVMVGNNQGHTPLTHEIPAQTTITLQTGSTLTDRWVIDADGDFVPSSDGAYDIGEDTKRAKRIFGGTLYGAHENYDSGWIARSDWTNVHLGSNTTKDTDSNLIHSLNANLSQLLVKVFISTDGTDTNSLDIIIDGSQDGSDTHSIGITVHQVSADALILQTGTQSAGHYVEADGSKNSLTDDDFYYKVKVWKLG